LNNQHQSITTMYFSRYLVYLLIPILFTACKGLKNTTASSKEKPKILWFDSEANFKRFSSKDSICYYLDKAKGAGFNEIVVDVRPVQGDVLYKSKILEPLTDFGDGYEYKRDWDYLQFFIDEARKRALKITVSASIMPVGLLHTKSGPAYRSKYWDDKISIGNTPEGLKNMKEMDYVGVFLNPNLSSVRTLVKSYVHEIVSNYDFDSFALDYCRFADVRFDFSDSSRVAFEKYINKKVERFPEDIFSYNSKKERVPGKYYKEWWEFRAMTVRDIVRELKQVIKSRKPDMKLTYWAASWINGTYVNGQNWASKGYFDAAKSYPEWATENYKNAGFADELDAFMVGAYLNDLYGMDNNESIEYALDRANKVIGKDTKVYGSLYALNHKENIADAVYLTLEKSAGLMVFDIVQVINFNLWDSIKEGIDRAESHEKI
jgi:uncharacterized lipoprotein YddW (UPF0748 family)